MSGESPKLSVESLELRLGRFTLNHIDLACTAGGYHILLGPTGSGKSSLLRCILGLHRIDGGRIMLEGRDITGTLPEHRRMGYVPQNYALFPHLSVEQNIRFGIDARGPAEEEAGTFLEKLLALFKINHLRSHGVQHLSGGERQKVAIARALGSRPELILLDEPFSSIDVSSRRRLGYELRQIVQEIGITALHITHNLEEAHVLGDRVFVLINGRLIQSGTPQEILERPATEAVGDFLSYRNIFHGVAEPTADGTRINMGPFSVNVREKVRAGESAALCIRPQDIKILKQGVPLKDSLMRNCFEGTFTHLFPAPEFCTAWFRIAGSRCDWDFELRFPRYLLIRHSLATGRKVRIAFWEPAIILWTGEERKPLEAL
ncbi:MAG: ABC transporter ATP-binding protein [Planctomycetota bacterium]